MSHCRSPSCYWFSRCAFFSYFLFFLLSISIFLSSLYLKISSLFCVSVCMSSTFEKAIRTIRAKNLKNIQTIRIRRSSTAPFRTSRLPPRQRAETRSNPRWRRQKSWPMRSSPDFGEFPTIRNESISFESFAFGESADRAPWRNHYHITLAAPFC